MVFMTEFIYFSEAPGSIISLQIGAQIAVGGQSLFCTSVKRPHGPHQLGIQHEAIL